MIKYGIAITITLLIILWIPIIWIDASKIYEAFLDFLDRLLRPKK